MLYMYTNVLRYSEVDDDIALPDGVFAELNSILAKDDKSLSDADKQFMWSKRNLLKSIPEALHKVLLSAPQYNYPAI